MPSDVDLWMDARNTHRHGARVRRSFGRASSSRVVAMVRCCAARDGAYAHIDGAAARREDVDAARADASRRGDDARVTPCARASDDDDDERSTTTETREDDGEGDGGDVIVAIDDDGDGGEGDGRGVGRRSAWDRAGATSTTASEDARSERSATHSTFGRHRRERKVSRAVERALGGAGAYDEDDDEEYAPTAAAAAAAKRAGDEEAGFGFVSKSDIARRDAERAAKAKAKAEAKAEAERAAAARKAAKELAKRKAAGSSDDDETISLLSADVEDGNQRRRSRKKGGKKMSVLAYTVIVSCAVVAACVGIVIYVPAPTTSSAVVSNSVATATDAGPVLTSSSSSSSSTVSKEKKKEMVITKDLEKKLTSKSRSKKVSAKDDDEDDESSTKSKKTSKSSSKSSTKDVEEDEYDEQPANEDEEDGKTSKSGAVEAKLGRFAWLDDDEVADEGADDAKEAPIRATRECAPIHVETRHGVYRQFNQECLASNDGVPEKPAGCMRGSADGCQSCYISNSPAASQLTSYSWCSQHVCATYGVTGCETDHSKRPSSTLGVDEKPATKSKKSAAAIAAAAAARDDGEACLPNLEDAKRGIFQYSAHHCRTMGHVHVDYSGCVSIGKSSCRMCVTKSTLQGTVFSLCPKSVCENHDLLYSQCADDDGVE